MKRYPVPETEPTDHRASPEQVLWLAVIERAILDYVFPTADSQKSHNIGLKGFFYETRPLPFNLQYICDNFLNYPGGASKIRSRIQQLRQSTQSKEDLNRSRRYKGYY